MAGFESLIDQKRPVRILSSYLEKQVFPPALLFTGGQGVGKYAAALCFAKACNCERYPLQVPAAVDPAGAALQPTPVKKIPCGACRSCRTIQSGNHPDVMTVRPSGQLLRVDQIRSVCDTLALKPYAARRRFVLFSNAEAMNPEAGNALLKTLEEPPPHTVLILCARQTTDVLPTIVSRCQHIHFNPLTVGSIRGRLQEEAGLDASAASLIAAMADGSLPKALQMVSLDWQVHRRWVLDSSGLSDPSASAPRQLRGRLAFAERLARDKTKATAALDIMAAWLRDLLVYPLAPDKVINVDLMTEIQYIAQNTPPATLIDQLALIQAAQRDLQSNANFRLVMERTMIRLAAVRPAGP